MQKRFDLVIRNGRVFDGLGSDGFIADVAIKDGLIVEVGDVDEIGETEIDAFDKIVTPGFVDIHTHYDGQATWGNVLSPSSDHGATTVVMGNCGVGFAPCRREDHDKLISLMEGVEDIPQPILAEGLEWNWESFEDYLDVLESRSHDIDFACQIPHGPLRVYVMGERGANREPASYRDIAEMADIVRLAIKAGAVGFSTSRTLNHKTSEGDPTPCYQAADEEMKMLAVALKDAGGGVLQLASDFANPKQELGLLEQMMECSGRPMIFSLTQHMKYKESYKRFLDWTVTQNAKGNDVSAMVCGRPIGIMLGLEASAHPFSDNPVYAEISDLPLADRVNKMRSADFRDRVLNAEASAAKSDLGSITKNYDFMFVLGDPPDYEQPKTASMSAMAAAKGLTPAAYVYDVLLQNDGHALLYTPFSNYADYSLDAALEMMTHENAVLGLGDGGAHVGMICDASFTTSMLSFWTRDRTRGEKLDLAQVIRAQTYDTARAYGLHDRGVIKPGYKADLNVINYDKLSLNHPTIVYDLPAGGKRLSQTASGYDATIVSGVIIQRHGKRTGALPGRLVRGEQYAPAELEPA